MCIWEPPVTGFDYESDGTNGLIITGYTGTARDVTIPAGIDGRARRVGEGPDRINA
jgi:hypothetical protein